MCSFSEGWETELPCSRVGLPRKDDVVQAGLWAKIAAASVEKRTAHSLVFGALCRTEMLWFVIYRIIHRAAFCWKAPSLLGLEENRKEKRRKAWKAGKGYRGSVLSCRSAWPHSAASALCCPLWCSLPLQGAELRRCAGSLSAGAGCQPASAAASARGRAHRTSRAKDPAPGFAGIALTPAKTRLKRTYAWGDGWWHYQPEECVSFSTRVYLEGKVAHGWAPNYMFRPNIQAAAPS